MRLHLLSRVVLGLSTLLLLSSTAHAAYRVVHVAGQADSGFSADGGPATDALLDHPRGLAIGTDGSLFIADTGNQRVRMIAPDGTITTIAGTGTADTTGDGGPAIEAALDTPSDVAVDAAGTVYIVTATSLRRITAADGHISTLISYPTWRYALANDAAGDVFIAVAPFSSSPLFEPYPQPFLISLPTADSPAVTPITVQSIEWSSTTFTSLAAAGPQRIVLHFDSDQNYYGVAQIGAQVIALSSDELYAMTEPTGVAVSAGGTVYLSAASFYSQGQRYVMRRSGSRFTSIAGGGQQPIADGALAESVSFDPRALATASDDLLYVVAAPSQIFALHREARRPGRILGRITSGHPSPLVTVLAAGDDGTLHYTQPDTAGHFQFADLPPGNYRVYAHYDEEGLSCDATNCGWSGLPNDCPHTLNDPVVSVSGARPTQHVRLQLLDSFPCF